MSVDPSIDPEPDPLAAFPQDRRLVIRIPATLRDTLPEPAPAVIPASQAVDPSGVVPRVRLFVRDTFNTAMTKFGIWREYHHRPSYDPENGIALEDLAREPPLPQSDTPEPPTDPILSKEHPSYAPHPNLTTAMTMGWVNNGFNDKSAEQVNNLVHNVILHPDFHVADLRGFDCRTENRRLNKAAEEAAKLPSSQTPFGPAFRSADIDISVPSGDKAIPPKTFTIPGLQYRPLVSIIRDAFTNSLSHKFHLYPFKLYHESPTTGQTTRIWSELYNSDAFINEHDRLQRRGQVPPDDPDCKLEKVVAALMLWSDSTHLAEFGTAKLWPIYVLFGNLSKYIAGIPKSGACQQFAFIPSVSTTLFFFMALNIP